MFLSCFHQALALKPGVCVHWPGSATGPDPTTSSPETGDTGGRRHLLAGPPVLPSQALLLTLSGKRGPSTGRADLHTHPTPRQGHSQHLTSILALLTFTLRTSLAWNSGVQLWWMKPMPPVSCRSIRGTGVPAACFRGWGPASSRPAWCSPPLLWPSQPL